MTALIVDDEEASRSTLHGFLSKYCPQITRILEAASVAEAVPAITQYAVTVVFLDIDMPYENGFALFEHIAQPHFHTIFVTAYDQYALKAIKQCAVDYILKPVNIRELIAAVEKVSALHETTQSNKRLEELLSVLAAAGKRQLPLPDKIPLPDANGLCYISVREIIRCEAEGSYTVFYFTARPKMVIPRSLGRYETLLRDYGFVRVHNHHLINLQYVERYQRGRGGTVIMSDKKEVMVAQRKRDEFLRLLGYSGGGDITGI